MTANVELPPEIEAGVRALAEESHRDVHAILVELIRDGLKAARKRMFDRDLLENNEAIERGEYVTEDESLARIEAIERGE
jgi:predicted transcriptional regulator